MATTIGTVGSGLIDIDATVKALVNNAKAPKQNQLDSLESKTTTKLTALGSLKSAVSDFQTAMALLNSPSSFLSRSVVSSNTAALNATATASAVAGTYSINVTQLAQGSKIASAAFSGERLLRSTPAPWISRSGVRTPLAFRSTAPTTR